MKKLFVFLTLAMGITLAHAEGDKTVQIVAKDGRFEPSTVEVAAGQRFVLVLRNEGKDAIEFESQSLRKERVVAPGREAKLTIAPLKAGEYSFYDEYHESTAQGRLIAK